MVRAPDVTVSDRGRLPLRSARPVTAAAAGGDGRAQLGADDRISLGDPVQRAPDGLAHGDPGSLVGAGEVARAATEPGGSGQLGNQPVPFGADGGGTFHLVGRLKRADLFL